MIPTWNLSAEIEFELVLRVAPISWTPAFCKAEHDFAGSIFQKSGSDSHSFFAKKGEIIELRPVPLANNNLYFNLAVKGPDNEILCDVSRWLGSSGVSNGLVFPAEEGEHTLIVTRNEESADGGPYQIRINRGSALRVSSCQQISPFDQ